MNNASMQIGSAIGLAALVSLGASQAAESPPARPPPARLSGQRIAKNR